MKALILIFLALCGFAAQAQTYTPAHCVVSYPSNASGQYQLHTAVGVPNSPKEALAWATAIAFQVPSGQINSASVVFPTIGMGYGAAASATVYLTIIPATDAANTCAGYGPGYVLSIKPKRDNPDLVVLAATVVTPLQTGDVTFTLNPKALGILRGMAGADAVFGVSMLVPRITIYPAGEDPKKVNQVGALVDFWRTTACSPTQPAYCPTLVIQ